MKWIRSWECALLSLLLVPGLARAEQVVFSEIMYHPPGTLPEYIEVYNNSATPLDMAEWRLRDGVDYDFPKFSAATPARTFLKPFERILLSPVDEATLRAAYAVPANIRIYGPWSGNLDNAGERITLKDKNGVVLCTVAYNDRGKWPVSADGAGHTLVLRDPSRNSDDWRNWAGSARRLGTPGTEPIVQAETPIASPEINLSVGLPFVNYADTWKFNDQNVDLGVDWRNPAYDDSAWGQGPGLLGFETAPLPAPGIRTPLGDVDQLTYYLRTRFVYNGPLSGVTLSLDQILDDGAVYYLNGVELGRSGMPTGGILFSTAANRNVGDAVEELAVLTASGSALVTGTNLLAVEVHQSGPTSSDVVFGARLNVSLPSAPSLVINEVLPAGPGAGFVELFNPGASTINLRNHYLTDDPANLQKFRITSDLPVVPGGFGVVGFTESGLGLATPVKVYLVGPDGGTIINAVNAAVALDGRSFGRKPAGGTNWYSLVEPTRGAANVSIGDLGSALRLNEVHFSTSNTVDWVEFYNASTAPVLLPGLALASSADFSDRIPLNGTVPARGFASANVNFPADDEVVLYLVSAGDTVLAAREFGHPKLGNTWQAFPDGTNEWYAAATPSRDASNRPARQTDIVINEIMYDPPSDESSSEFIELYNRGTNTVDLSGWRLSEAVDFVFPGGTLLAPGSYLVIAADVAWMQSTYGAIAMLGNFEGQLGNRGELIRLLDHWGNLADEVDYLPGGNWPNLANGDGTSMELRNPWMDNRLASAWTDSNETNKAPFQHYSFADVFRQLNLNGAPTDYKELHLHLVGDSHVVLRNVQVRLNGTGANLLGNTGTMSADGRSASGWLAQGTHYLSHLESGDLHLVADGHGDNRANRVEIDAGGLTAGSTYEVSFDARWVAGASRLIVQTWDHSLGTTFSLAVPRNLGTPGFQNSRYAPLPPPQVDGLLHAPVVPAAGQIVRVTAAITSSGAAPQVQLFHRLDNVSGNAAWSSKAMFDNGANGDAVAGDGIYTAQLTEYPSAGQVVQFYVVASAAGQSSLMPKWGATRPAMYVVDTPSPAGDLRRMRFIVSALDLQTIANQNTPTPGYGYAQPRLSNHYYNMTCIVNEQEVIYNCEVRTSGSPWTRGGNLDRGKFKVPKDHLLRGKEKYSYDNDPAGGARHHNRISRYWLYLFGHPGNENEYIQVEINNRGTALREEVEPLGNDMLDRIYPDGSQGELYRIDDEWWFTDDWTQTSRNADWSYKGTDNGVRYHTEWMKRTRENDYDYSSLVGLFRTITAGTYSQSAIERLLDPLAVMKMAAVRGYTHDWDSFSLDRGKNGYFYRRSTDGLFMFWHWDSDLAFDNTGAPFYNGMTGYRPYLEKPYNFRLFKHYLATLVESYARNSARMTAWLQAEEDASTQYTVATATYQSWFSGREPQALSLLGNSRTNVFDITSNGGAAITTSADTLALAGVAPLHVFRVDVVGHPEAVFTWTTEVGWSLSGLILRSGLQTLVLNAVDESGNILHTDSINVTKTGNAAPQVVLEANPQSWHVSLLEALELEASRSYDPDGGLLSYQWSVTPADVQFETSGTGQSHATAFFPRPGLYQFSVTATDSGGASNRVIREAAVYAPEGFSAFSQASLEPYWSPENVVMRENHVPPAYYSLREHPGDLLLAVQPARALPLASATPAYPVLWRTLPALTEWALLTKVSLRGQVFGDYFTGLLVELNEGGALVRYAFGIDDGVALNVRRVTSAGSSTLLRSTALTVSEAEIRIRRVGNTLFFEQRTNDVWTQVHSAGVPADTSAIRGGLFVSTDTPQAVKSLFDYVILIDPSATTDLRQNLRISEIMYNPVGGGDYEFVELVNLGAGVLDLSGVRFSAGIDYTFGRTVLGPRQYLIVAKNQAAFASRYSTSGVTLAPGEFLGQLNNAGETLELSDSNGVVFLSVTYGDAGLWPVEADGSGSSLEAISPGGNLNAPSNWRASPEAGGSPGRAGGDALGTVVINEVLTHTDPPFEDAIEVFNRTGAPINIGGWFLSDSKGDFKKYRIPDNTLVPARGFRVFYEYEFNGSNAISPFSLSSASGDQVYLSAADAAGNLTGYRSPVDFDAAANAVSFGRYETSLGWDFPPLAARTFGQDSPTDVAQFRQGTGLSNAPAQIGPIVLNELMFRPPDIGGTNDNTQDEFVEVYNITSAPVSLFDPVVPTNTWRLRGGVDFNFPTNVSLAPRAFALLVSFDPAAATNAALLAAFRSTYGLPASVALYGPYEGKLDNRGEEVKLTRPDTPQTNGFVPHLLVDRVVYADAAPWPAGADGAGASVQRRRPHEYGNDPVNWKAAAPTPGRANQPNVSFTDTDADGMPDSYETANAFLVNDPSDAALDADGDGRSNYQEFLDGTQPRNAADRLVAPSISSPASGLALAAGATATFSVTATGTAPLSYQWRFRGVALGGATNATLSLPNVQSSQAGEYSVVVHNAAGFVHSAEVLLTVNEPLQILAQPLGRVVDRGSTVTFTVFAAGTGPLRYQWRFNGAPLTGATNSSFVLSGVQTENAGNYSVVVTDNSGSLTSADATLSVLSPPTIAEQPQAKTAVAYTDVFFSVVAGGEGPFRYQWRLNALAIPGATNSLLSLPNVQPNQAGSYTVEVFNPVASVVSSNALLTLLLPATIVQQPLSTNVAPGGNATFTVLASSSTPMRYQWRFNDVDLPGATNASLSIFNAQEENSGNYSVVITDGVGSIRSQAAVLGIIIPLSFVQIPLSQSVPVGGSVTFSVEIRGGPVPYGVEWRRISTPIASNAQFSTKAFFTLSNVQPSDATTYRVVVRTAANTVGIGSAPVATLTVLADFDHDGIPDTYETTLGLNTNNTADASGDLDGDGVSNVREYQTGTDPLDPVSHLRVDELQTGGQAAVIFGANSNKTYTVEYCDNLTQGAWQKLDDLVARSTNDVRIVPDPGTNPQRFYRVVTPRRP
jgi:hypothetical protein